MTAGAQTAALGLQVDKTNCVGYDDLMDNLGSRPQNLVDILMSAITAVSAARPGIVTEPGSAKG